MEKKLLVYTESESFLEFYREAATAAGLGLEVRGDLNEAARVVLVVVSAPGQEERAADRVRDAAAVAAAAPVVVGSLANHRVAIEMIQAGADHYFVLPEEAEALRDYVRQRVEMSRAREARAQLAAAEQRDFDFSKIVGESRAMREALAVAARIIPRGSATVLLTGETGTGKELLAQAIHYNGPRREGPFVELNCSAIPANLLESELFGHERGAFTDARRAKPGLLEVADGGTLFLDEIGEMVPALQAKLLRALQERKIQRVGGEELIGVDVRIIAASNRDLEAAIETGEVRRDLYYRLGVVTLTLPPLRERREDIPELVGSYVRQFRVQLGRQVAGVRPEALEALGRYTWPGNVRELVNVIERAVLLSKGQELTLEDLPENVVASIGWTPKLQPTVQPGWSWLSGENWLEEPLDSAVDELVSSFEREYLTRVLEATSGRVGEAARRAGVHPRTLYNKMKLYNLRKEDFKPH